VGPALAVLALLVTAACSTTGASGGSTTSTTTGAGAPWIGGFATETLPTPVNSLTDVACPTTSRCWAVGSTVGGAGAPNGAAVITTRDGGMTWSNQVIPPEVGYLSRVACSGPRSCTAVGQATQTTDGQGVAIFTVDGGATWSSEPVPAGILDVTAVDCLASGRCIAVGTTAGGATALVSVAPGSGWTTSGALPPGVAGATAISCSDVDDCWVTARTAVGADNIAGAVAVTTDGGGEWATVATPKGLGYLDGLSCLEGPTSGSGAVPPATTSPTTTSPVPAGAAPTTPTTPPAPTPPTPVVGVAGARCTVVGTTATSLDGVRTGRGVLLTTDNGGATWTGQTVAGSSATLMDVSCASIGDCVAVGSTVTASPQAGLIVLSDAAANAWGDPSVVRSPQSLSAVSCISLSSCVVVGESISEHLTGG
jgi:hypothetical protein